MSLHASIIDYSSISVLIEKDDEKRTEYIQS